MPEQSGHFAALFVELGLIIAGLALLARMASRAGISAIPLYLLAGLAFDNGGIAAEPQLGPLSAAYVLLLAILGPVAARVVK